MRNRLVLACALLLAGSAGALPAAAQDAAAGAEAAGSVPQQPRLPFAPPPGRRLEYATTLVLDQDGVPDGAPIDTTEVLTFTPDEGGYIVVIDTRSITIGGERHEAGVEPPPTLAPFPAATLAFPLTLDADRSGLFLRGRDWAAQLPRATQAVRVALERYRPASEAERRNRPSDEQILEQFSKVTAEAVPWVHANQWFQIFGFGGSTAIGKANEWSSRRGYLKGEAYVDTYNTFRATPQPGGGFRINREAIVDPTGFAEAVDAARSGTDKALQAESRTIDGNLLMDRDRVTRTDLTIDERGVPQAGTLTITTERNGKVLGTYRWTFKLVGESEAPAAATATAAPAAAETAL